MDEAIRYWFRREAEQAMQELRGEEEDWFEHIPEPMNRFGHPEEIVLPLSWADVTEDDAE